MLKSLIQSNDKKVCKVDLFKQLININKDEIDGLIFDSTKTNIVEIKEEFFKKIVPNFSQDIIAFTSISIFKTKNPIDFQNIISIYNSSEHRSLFHYLAKMKNQKNIIYTFSHILDLLMKGLEVKNKIFGTINFNTIYKKIIEDNCSEKLIEKYIQTFLNNEKYNVLIFQIHSNNYDQTFIYNLNGKDTLITEIIELKNVQLYKNPRVYEMNG